MDFGKELLFFFSALGTFNGLMLSLYFLLFNKKKYLTNYFIGALILMLSIRVGKSIFAYFDPALPKIYLQIGLSGCFFIGPFLYLFLNAAITGNNVMKRQWTFMLATCFALVIIVGIIYPYRIYPTLWNHYLIWVIYIQWLFFIIAAGFMIRKLLKKFFTQGESMLLQEKWLLTIYVGTVIIFIFYFLALARAPLSTYIGGAIVFSFLLYLAIIVLFYRNRADSLFQLNVEKDPAKKINEVQVALLIDKLEQVTAIDLAFKDPDLKLSDLAKRIGISPNQLSLLLNDYLNKNFTSYINGHRIAAACAIISKDNRLTLESVGYEVGFNSKSTFFAAFKKHTGTTPLAYQQQNIVS